MAEENDKRPIIIIKKKGGHGGHHGGAWKVAYADFVTAMMAFFMVMWLMNSTPQVKEAISSYFQDPSGVGKQTGSGMAGAAEGLNVSKENLEDLKDQLESAMKQMPKFEEMKDQVQMTVTGEGLRIELLETEKGMFFESGRMRPSTTGEELLILLARQLADLPNHLLIEGHTDARPFNSADGYSNWELSADRANAARALMEAAGLRNDQVVQVRGFADRRLRNLEAPGDASNRRVSIIVKYLDAQPSADGEGEGEGGGESGHHEAPKPAASGHH